MSHATLDRLFPLILALGIGNAAIGACAEANEDLQRAAEHFREVAALCSADDGQLWGVSLAGPMMLVDPKTRVVYANQADAEGHFKPQGGLFVGTLPPSVPIANTAFEWAGTHWTQMMWPLPTEDASRRVLVMHESWHRVQDQCGLPAASPTNQHLNTFDGRYWLQLEWRALERALRTEGDSRREAIEDALLFRHQRHRLVPSSAEQECELEAHEGLAEYTGIRLSGMSDAERLAYAARQLAELPARLPTFNRSFAYLSGPAYGLLLDTTDRPWRQGLAAGADLAGRLQELLALDLPEASAEDLTRRAERYDGAALRAGEEEREQLRQKRHAALQKQYFEDAVLTLPLKKIQLMFDPRNLEAVGELGTYYPTLTVLDLWGKLVVTEGAFMSADFKTVKVTAPADQAAPLSGPGWTLELAPGWQVIGDERPGHFRAVPEDPGR